MKETGHPEVLALLLQLIKENSGVEVQERDADSSFFELGLDSLFLTQFSVSLASRFGVKLTFRQLSAQFDTLNKLSAFLSEAAGSGLPSPPPAVEPGPARACLAGPASTMPAAPTPARPALAPAQRDPLIQLFLGQLEVMQRQLDALVEAAEPAIPAAASAGVSAAAPAAIGNPGAVGATQAKPAARAAGMENPPSAAVLDASRPPVPGARLGRDPSGQPAWFIPRADHPGKYVKLI